MSFQIEKPTQILITNANPRRELHGTEKVRAIDIVWALTGENTLLDLIEPGLREHHYCNHALKSGQETLPNVVIPLPNLRHPKLPTKFKYADGEKWRGYRFVWDWGTEEDHVDFTDVVLANLGYELNEGGSVTIKGTIQYNGEELQDNDLYGELSGLASEGEISVMLLAPAELMPAKKGYRAGRPDTPPPPGGAEGDGKTAGDIFAEQHGSAGGPPDDTDADADSDADADADADGKDA